MFKVCLDLLEALDKVDPGYSQLRGKYMGKAFFSKKDAHKCRRLNRIILFFAKESFAEPRS
jgi:hypothetical protein